MADPQLPRTGMPLRPTSTSSASGWPRRWPGSTCAVIPTTGSTGCAVVANPDAAQRWGLRLLEDPALDARDAHPAWFPDHDAVVQLYPDADPPPDADAFDVLDAPGPQAPDPRRQAPGADGALARPLPALRARRPAWTTAWPTPMPSVPAPRRARAITPGGRLTARRLPACARPAPAHAAALLELHTLQALDADPGGRVLARGRRRAVRRGCRAPIGTATAACVPRCAAWCGAAMR